MKAIFIICSLCCSLITVNAQFYDNHWLLGYEGGAISEPDDSFGISILSFYDANLLIENNQLIDIGFDGAGNSFSDREGELLLFCNGLEIRNSNDVQLLNGDLGGSFGDPESIFTQSFLFLPHSEGLQDISLLRMLYTEDSPRLGEHVEHFRVDPFFDNIGTLYDENSLAGVDSLSTGELIACRHANGRDWWVLIPKTNNCFIRY